MLYRRLLAPLLFSCQLLALGAGLVMPVSAQVSLPRLLSDGAILQRDQAIHIWGWAETEQEVRVNFAGQEQTVPVTERRWQASFEPLPAGGPHELKVSGTNTLIRRDILMGDLWLAAGEANMALPLERVQYRYPGVLEASRLPKLREFNLAPGYAFNQPLADYAQGQWLKATPESLADFSAVGFFFARQIHRVTRVPIGLLRLPVEDSPAQAWMSEAALQDYPGYLAQLEPFKAPEYVRQVQAQDNARHAQWYANLAEADLGLQNNWSAPALNTETWNKLQLPGFFAQQGSEFRHGSVWLRKDIHLTRYQAAKQATLWLGGIAGGDEVYLNGERVGQTSEPDLARIYPLRAGLLRPGNNSLVVRLISPSGNPGFVPDKPYALVLEEPLRRMEQVSLDGQWRYQIGATLPALTPPTNLYGLPSALFKAQLAPALPLRIRGVIWYQGEANVARSAEYQQLFSDLIGDWRSHFDQGEFPFLFVQLANYLPAKPEPGESDWAALREAQRQTLALNNSAMAVAIDVGEWNDIHPQNKQAVGERLALAALKLAYGNHRLLASGPVLQTVTAKQGKLELLFGDVGRGLKVRSGKVKHMAIAGADKRFVWAQTRVKKDRVLVWSEAIAEPKWVRYAWADNPEGANLYNSAGLPASPFEASVDE